MASMVFCIFVFTALMASAKAQIAPGLMPLINRGDQDTLEFQNLVNQLGKILSNPQELITRLDNFKRSKAIIANLESKYATATFAPNKFSLMSKAEQEQYFGSRPIINTAGSTAPGNERTKRSVFDGTYTTSIPSSFDFRTYEKVTSIKEQRNCASCWAFASTAAIESQSEYLIRQNLASIDLSEQDLVNCKEGGGGCGGANVANTLERITRDGIAKEDCLPYQAAEGQCGSSCQRSKIDGYRSFGSDESTYAEKLYNYGPAVMSFQADEAFMYYKSGILDSPAAQCTGGWHAILIVGYTPDYWIAKNSFGFDQWGENGFVRFKRGQNYCNFTIEVVAPYLNVTATTTSTTTTTTTTTKAPTTTSPLYKAVLFENTYHQGAQLDLSGSDTNCHDIPTTFQNKSSSVDGKGGCILLYPEKGCNGERKLIIGNCQGSECCGNHFDLGSCALDNKVSSYAFCNPNSPPAPTTTTTTTKAPTTTSSLYKAVLFENTYHQGAQLDLSASDTNCHDIPITFENKSSSVDGKGGCILLYPQKGCNGERKLIIGNCQGSECCGNYFDLGSCALDNKVSSYAFCNPNSPPAPTTTTTTTKAPTTTSPLYKTVLFENTYHQGAQLDLSASDMNCRDIPITFENKSSSVDGKGGCILLYPQKGCNGERKLIIGNCQGTECCGNHFDLGSCALDNKVSSYAFCNPNSPPAPTTTTTTTTKAPTTTAPLYKTVLFENTYHQGAQLDLSGSDTNCHDIPITFENKSSSVDGKGGCILLYPQKGCNGERKLIIGSCQGTECCGNHFDLGSCALDNKVSSYAFCNPNSPPTACVDASEYCSAWATHYNYCTDPQYTPAGRKENCAKTCGLC